MKKLATTTAVFLLIVLAACTAESIQPIETARPSATALSIQPTPTKTPTPTPTISAQATSNSAEDNSDPTPPPTTQTSTAELLITIEPIPFIESDVAYVIALQGMEVQSGPGYDYDAIDVLLETHIAQVTGQSLDGEWWRILCPDDTAVDCWVPAIFAHPIDAPSLEAALPDPATLEAAGETAVPSPDGRWLATAAWSENATIANHIIYFYATVTVTDGTTTWTPLAEWRPFGSESTRPRIVQWSDDGRYLYYTDVPDLEGCYIFINGSNLIRLDTTDGSILEILPNHTTFNLALSPDQSWVAYISYGNQQMVLVLREMPSGPKHHINLTGSTGYVQTGEIFWSADSATAILTVMHDVCYNAQTSSILRIDTETLIATPIIANDSRLFTIRDWPDPTQPLIRLRDGQANPWWLNIETGELTAE